MVSAMPKSNRVVREAALGGLRARQVRGRNQLRLGVWAFLAAVFAVLTFLGMVLESSGG